MLDSIAIVRKLNAVNSPAVNSVVTDIKAWALLRGVDVIEENDDNVVDDRTLFVAIGGDGTVIHAAKLASEVGAPVLGFNLGKVGFLADFDPKSVDAALHGAFDGTLDEDQRMLISIRVNGRITHMALNDFVLSCKLSDTTLTYDLIIDRTFAGSHTANGVIISTPTGSTAYALSVGGAIIMPGAEAIQVVPIAAQTLTSRPLIVSAESVISIKFPYSFARPVSLRADGQTVMEFDVPTGSEVLYQTISIDTLCDKVTMLHHKSWNHFDVLNKKLNWNS